MQLEDLEIKYADEAEDKTKEECCPGVPYITFSVKPGLSVRFVNPQISNGLFEASIKISHGDTVKQVITRLAKEKNIKGALKFHNQISVHFFLNANIKDLILSDSATITLYRHEDPVLGPRVIPTENILSNRQKISDDAVFSLDLKKEIVSIQFGNKTYNIGGEIVYCAGI